VSGGIQMTTYDLNPRVNDHIEAARRRARRGAGYTVQLPRDPTQRWQRDLVSYWTRFGESIGEHVPPMAAPPAAGRVDVRAVRIRPDVVQAITPRDVNIIVQRPEPLPEGERFDLVIATNILIYYDVFEQSLAAANIAQMLHSGGVLLTNNPLFELPAIPMHQIGETKAAYTDTGFDYVAWYQRE
jgi:hypothetical protein